MAANGAAVLQIQKLLNRYFQADRPNHKWVSDISYIMEMLTKYLNFRDKSDFGQEKRHTSASIAASNHSFEVQSRGGRKEVVILSCL